MMNRITQYRMQAGWSASDISRRFQIPARIVECWERGELVPPAWVEQRIRQEIQAERRQQQQRRSARSGGRRP